MTAPNEYEPSAEAVEALAHEVHAMYESGYRTGVSWDNSMVQWTQFCRKVARFVLRRQHARESGLLLAVAQLATLGGGHSDGNRIAQAALGAHAKLDAPKVPTLLEAAKRAMNAWDGSYGSAIIELKAAVEREEKREKR